MPASPCIVPESESVLLPIEPCDVALAALVADGPQNVNAKIQADFVHPSSGSCPPPLPDDQEADVHDSKVSRVWTALARLGSLMCDVGIASSCGGNDASGALPSDRCRELFPLPLPTSLDECAITGVPECSALDAVKYVRVAC